MTGPNEPTNDGRDPFVRIKELEAEAALWRDCFSEITAKATPYGSAPPDDPERITAYLIPAGPLHRAAGKTGQQMFEGEKQIAALKDELAEAQRTIRTQGAILDAKDEQLADARAKALEDAARLIETHQEHVRIRLGQDQAERYLDERRYDDRAALAFAAGIRALAQTGGGK